MENGPSFHDFPHVLGVYQNVESLLKYESGSRLVLLTASLLHDTKRGSEDHGTEGAKYAKSILLSIPEFPDDLIEPVAQVIYAHDKEQRTSDEKLFYDADKMDAFNKLGIARSLMMMSQEGLTLKESSFKLLKLTDYFYNSLHTSIATYLIRKNYEETRIFALDLVGRYNL